MFEKKFGDRFKLGSSARGPDWIQFFGLNINQNSDVSSTIDGEDNLTPLEGCPLTRYRRRQHDDSMNDLERSSFMSANISIGWVGFTASPLCPFYDIYLQQTLPTNTFICLTLQTRCLNLLER